MLQTCIILHATIFSIFCKMCETMAKFSATLAQHYFTRKLQL